MRPLHHCSPTQPACAIRPYHWPILHVLVPTTARPSSHTFAAALASFPRALSSALAGDSAPPAVTKAAATKLATHRSKKMKLFSFSRGLFFLGATALFLLKNQAVAKPRSYWDGVQGIVKACDDFDGEGEIVASGTVTFLRPLQCKADAPMVFHIYNTTTIRSHAPINTTNVHFIVHPEASLIFTAKAIVMARDEGSSLPLLKTSGMVLFNVTRWTPSYTDGGLEDKEDVIQVLEGGEVFSNHHAHFTTTTLVVANEQARGEPEHTIKLSPYYEKKLKDYHAGLDSSKKQETTTESVGITAARKASRENAASPELIAEYKVSSRIAHVNHQIIAKAKAKASNTVTPDLTPASTPSPALPASPELSAACPKNPWARKPTCSLQVGEELMGTLRSADGRSAMWPGVDGSLRFGKFLTPDGEERGKGGVGIGVMGSTNLLGSESDKAREALILRRELKTEGGGGVAGGGGKEQEKEAKAGGTWWSWRQPSKQRRREIAAENIDEVCVSVSNKGCVKVTVDGTTVLSKSGRFAVDWMNRLPWQRPRDEGYELHVTDSGMEVRLGERPVWGVNANEWLD